MKKCYYSYTKLENSKFRIVVKKRRREQFINITFPNHPFYHLVKFGDFKSELKIKEIKRVKTNNLHSFLSNVDDVIYDKIINSNSYYNNERRLTLLSDIESILSNNFTICKYSIDRVGFPTSIRADFVMRFKYDFYDEINSQCYIFLSKESNRRNDYFIKTIISDRRDFCGFERPFGIIEKEWV